MAAVTVQEFVCCCVFALPESPCDGEITGLSNQQMQTAENNIIRSPQRGILRGPGWKRRTDNIKQRKLVLLLKTWDTHILSPFIHFDHFSS